MRRIVLNIIILTFIGIAVFANPKDSIVPDTSQNHLREFAIKNLARISIDLKKDTLHSISLFVLPMVGWNDYDKFMPGLLIHSNYSPYEIKKTQWFIMPLFSSNTDELVGSARIDHYFYPSSGIFEKIGTRLSISRYHYNNETSNLAFLRLSPEVKFTFKNHDNSTEVRALNFRVIGIDKDEITWNNNLPSKTKNDYYINELAYQVTNNRKSFPYHYQLVVQQNNVLLKAFVEASYRFSFENPKKGFDLRFYAGKIFSDPQKSGIDYRQHISGAQGSDDYTYDYIFLARTNGTGFLSHQFAETDGAFKTLTWYGITWNWLASVNAELSLPGLIPFKLFGDLGFYPDETTDNATSLYDAGIMIPLFKNKLRIFLPLVYSDKIKQTYQFIGYDTFYTHIRFSLDLEFLNPR